MTKDQIKTVLDRIPAWPERRQQELAEIALDIEAEMSSAPYNASEDELKAIDEGMASPPARKEEVATAFARFRRR
jgi:hypothetical protein